MWGKWTDGFLRALLGEWKQRALEAEHTLRCQQTAVEDLKAEITSERAISRNAVRHGTLLEAELASVHKELGRERWACRAAEASLQQVRESAERVLARHCFCLSSEDGSGTLVELCDWHRRAIFGRESGDADLTACPMGPDDEVPIDKVKAERDSMTAERDRYRQAAEELWYTIANAHNAAAKIRYGLSGAETAEEPDATTCPTCSVCAGSSHHWIQKASEAMPGGWFDCGHCNQKGLECRECEGQGCDDCDGEGVILTTFDFCLECGNRAKNTKDCLGCKAAESPETGEEPGDVEETAETPPNGSYEKFAAEVEAAELTPHCCSPGYWQINGGRWLVDVWPQEQGVWMQRLEEGSKLGDVSEAIALAKEEPSW